MALDLQVKVHPVVLFQIIDTYERRNAGAYKVVGSLLGYVDKGVVEVTNSFCVPHMEQDEHVQADIAYAKEMYDLYSKANTNENIVGWWATGNEVTNYSYVINDFYVRECGNPVHLTVDTSLQGGRMGIKAYACMLFGTPNGEKGGMFTPIPLGITCYDPEVFGLQLCQKTIGPSGRPRNVNQMMDLAQVSEAGQKMGSLLDQVLAYVEDVLAERQPPNNAVGRRLLHLVNSVPHMTQEQFSEMFNSNVKDLLMVIALSQLVKTQLQLNEKLTLLTSV